MSAPSIESRLPAILVGLAIGFGLWALSPILLARREPWDTEWPAYTLTMLIGGAAAGWLLPGRAQWFYLGLWLGQVLAIAFLPGGDSGWLPLGVVTTAIGSLIGLIGYVPAWLLRRFLWQRRTNRP